MACKRHGYKGKGICPACANERNNLWLWIGIALLIIVYFN